MKHNKLLKLTTSLLLALCLASQTAVSFTVSTAATAAATAPKVISFMKAQDIMAGGVSWASSKNESAGKYTFDKQNGGLVLQYEPGGSFGTNFVMMKIAGLTSEHKYMRVTYKTNDTAIGSFTAYDNANPGKNNVTIVNDASVSRGEWVRSNAVLVGQANILDRLAKGSHVTFGYTGTPSDDTTFTIGEMAFFATAEEAYAYYGDEYVEEAAPLPAMTFGAGGTTGLFEGANYGICDTSLGTLDVTYADTTNFTFETGTIHYMAKVKFTKSGIITPEHLYLRAYYSASMPTEEGGDMCFKNDGKNDTATLVRGLKDTGGQFVLSDVGEIQQITAERLVGGTHCSLYFTGSATDNVFKVKAIYFFTSKEEAEAFSIKKDYSKVDIAGNDIAKYQIVVAEDAPDTVKSSAGAISTYLFDLTGANVPVVTDDKPVSDFEILIGASNRPETASVFDEASLGGRAKTYDNGKFVIAVMGNKLVVTSKLAPDTADGVTTLLNAYLGKAGTPAKEITVDSSKNNVGAAKNLYPYTGWGAGTNVGSPEVFTDDFDTDDGYFTEESNAQNWNLANGAIRSNSAKDAFTYLHVYEKNASVSAKWQYISAAAGSGAEAGLALRHTADDAYVKAGYDFDAKEWYIESREGEDFYRERVASVKTDITPNTVYDLTFKAEGDTATLSVNGKVMLTAKVSQLTPGRVGFYSSSAKIAVDETTIVLLSGEGTIWKDVVHTKLPGGGYIEGGSVIEMSDGSLKYIHHAGTTFDSSDNGKTWTLQPVRFTQSGDGYVNYIRLNNGDLFKIFTTTIDGVSYKISKTSNSDGLIWTDGGIICTTQFRGDPKTAGGNMNDKVFQSATTDRIFYCQSYEGSFDGRSTFGEMFYSDDNGKTWTKSEMGTWEIEGNEDEKWFGESKIIECADGTLRLYNSHNGYPCIVYSESKDNGVTWGPIQMMSDFICARSSMAIVRDPYAENDTTYYMVWVNSPFARVAGDNGSMTRSRLTLAKSTDGKEWTVLGDLWRWESNYRSGAEGGPLINHIVDPFVQVDEDYVIAGTGLSESMVGDSYHMAQRQHIWTVKKDSIDVGEKLYNFTDVTTKDASYEAFKFCVDNGLFNGTSATTMGPKVNVSRAMFATVLGRLNGADMTKYTTPTFKDVVAGQWYTNFVEWAAANNVITGYPGGIYGINDNITVEQACLILARYNGFKAGKDGKTLADFTDAASVSSWAADGVKWAVESGVYEGSGTLLSPTAPASRALMAEMMYNYSTIFGK